MMAAFKYALRGLRKAPAFALTVIVTLGLGIGLNAAIFTVIDNVLLKPLGYQDADRIVALETRFNEENRSIPRLAMDDYDDLARTLPGLEATARYQSDNDGMRVAGSSVYTAIAAVSPRFMQIMGVEPVAGRLFRPDAQTDTDALITEGFARDHFGSAEAALGQPLVHGVTSYTIVGVLPGEFAFPARTQAWLETTPFSEWHSRSGYNDRAVGRIRKGLAYAQFTAQLRVFSDGLSRQYTDDRKKSITAAPLQDQLVRRIRPTLHLLMGSVLVVLLIVAVNLTHLQLVRNTRQMREISVRTALGASRSILAGRAMLEAVLLALGGTVLALLLAVPALKLMLALAPDNTPRLGDVHLNFDVLLFSAGIALLVMAATSLLPVWRSWHADPAQALRADAARGGEARGANRLRNSFVVAEVALTLVLSVLSMLLTRQLIAQSRQDMGFQTEALLVLDTHAIATTPSAPPPANADGKALQAYYATLYPGQLSLLQATLATLRGAPDVIGVDAVDAAPMSAGSNAGYAIEGRQAHGEGIDLPSAEVRNITPGYFKTLGVRILSGRTIEEHDRLGAPKVAVISQSMARKAFGQEDPLGKRLWTGSDDDTYTIVGVVADTRIVSPALEPEATLYLAMNQHPYRVTDAQYVVRTRAAAPPMLDSLTRLLKRTHPELAVRGATMERNIGLTQQADHFRTVLFGSFAGVSILLAALGMYGVTAYTVAQRRFEFGLRVALGANRQQLLTMVLRGALTLAGLGVAIGVVLSLGLERVLGSVVGVLPAFDAVAYAVACMGVLGIALLATLLPARRAAGVDPMTVLRSE